MLMSTCLLGIVFGMISYRRRHVEGYVQGSTSHIKDDEENVALATKGKKKKSKKGSKGGTKQQDGEKKDMSKVKCFFCQKFGHYVDSAQTTRRKNSRHQLQ